MDEVKDFLNTRYISPPEAMWRLLEFPMHERFHAVHRLTVHLPDKQMVYFTGNDIETIASIARNKNTPLTAWFLLNENDEEARNYLYPEIPIHYVWDKKDQLWKKRQQGKQKIVTRMYAVSTKDSERFYLRLLLQNIKGARTYDDLKTVKNICYPTFKQAATAMNLTESDVHWENCLQEASQVCTPKQLQFIFAIICIYNSPEYLEQLFKKF